MNTNTKLNLIVKVLDLTQEEDTPTQIGDKLEKALIVLNLIEELFGKSDEDFIEGLHWAYKESFKSKREPIFTVEAKIEQGFLYGENAIFIFETKGANE